MTRIGLGIRRRNIAAVVATALVLAALGRATVAQEPASLPPADERVGPNWEGADWSPKPPVLPVSPEEEQASFILQPGYHMTPVLTDPAIQQPASIAFDGNGRMYVLELRTYMLDADATDELTSQSRISRWEDTNNDGIYETGTVFVDGLVFPRFVTTLGDGVILTKDSNSGDVWMYTDTNGDGAADKRELFTTDFGRSANVEHQEAELTWLMDNWMVATRHAIRLRWTPDGALREPIGDPGGSWGITQDDDGKMYSQGGASGVPDYFQFPVHYGEFDNNDNLDPGLRTPYGAAIRIADMQGGMDSVRMPDGSLNGATAGAGADIFRGHRLPEALRGNYFYGEVVARIVRRLEIQKHEGLTRMRNVYEDQQDEFLKSTDPLFRPVGMNTAPDGTMYITDMYHGIIQEAQWAQRGTYLRGRIEQYGLDEVINLGRIWRLSHESLPRDTTQPRMHDETPAQLVEHLDHPNGWWRDTAQKELVLRQDASVTPALAAMARTHDMLEARFHALWSLEGIGTLDAALVREMMVHTNPRMRVQAVRLSESLYKAGERSLADDLRQLTGDADVDVRIHALLAMHVLELPDAAETIRAVAELRPAAGIALIADEILNVEDVNVAGRLGRSEAEMALLEEGHDIYRTLCTECHGPSGRGTPAGDGQTLGPALAGNPRVTGHPEGVIKTILHGLTGPIDGVLYAGGVMVPQGQPDAWVAAVASYIRTNLTNNALTVTPGMVAAIRADNSGRTTPWTADELDASVPVELTPGPDWTGTASHAAPTRIGMTGNPLGAFSYEGWTTGVSQEAGMWWQVELPEARNLTEFHFYVNEAGGGRGRGGAPPPPVQVGGPRNYRVEISTDGDSWTEVATGAADGTTNVIGWEPTMARFLRITQTADASGLPPWEMFNARLYARPNAQP